MKPATIALALGLASLIAFPAAAAEDTLAPTLVEVQPDPTGDVHDEEWVEFANPAPVDVELDGLYLTDHDSCFAPGEGFVETYRWSLEDITVPAGERLVVELPDAANCLNLANDGDEIALEDEQGNVLQSVSYGAEGDLPVPSSGQSLSACHGQALVHGGWSLATQSPGTANQACSLPAN